jgi:SAM-dependent methyltransferase
MQPFDDLVGEAVGVPVTGWEFAWLSGHTVGSELTWSYPDIARSLLHSAGSLLDLDTGGGELLADLAPLPPHTVAVESWTPNVPVARDRLTPLGISVVTELPSGESEFDVVLSRHGRLPVTDIARLLRPAGTLLSQQVGSDDMAELNAALGAPPPHPRPWSADVAVAAVRAAGLQVEDVREERPMMTFRDIGAIVFQLRAVPWQVRDFTPRRYERELRRLDEIIRTEGGFPVTTHRFLIRASRP